MQSEKYHGVGLTPWSAQWIRIRAWRHIIDMLKLSPPIIASRLAGYFLVVVDTLMVLRYSSVQNQWLSVGAGTSNIFIGATFGITLGVPVLISRYFGAKDYKKIGDVWRQGIIWSIITGGIFNLLCIFLAKPIMQIGNPDIIKYAYPIAVIYSFSFIPNMIWMVGSSVLEATKRPVPVFILSIFGNILNIFLNWFFVYGILFFPEWGALGSAIASLLVRIFMAIITTAYLLSLKQAKEYNLRSFNIEPFKKWVELRMQGYAAAISIFFEAGGWSLFSLYAVRKPLTEVDTAAWTINMNILATVFMVAHGLSIATGVRVGIARGRKNFDDQILAIIIGVLLTVVALIISGGIIAIYAQYVATIFTNDPKIILFAASFVIYILWFFIPDGIQAVLGQSLRTSGIAWATTVIASFFYGIVSPILAFFLAFHYNHGIKGFFEAIILAGWMICICFFGLIIIRYRNMEKLTMQAE